MVVTAQIKRSFSDNGRQPTAQELAVAEIVRAAVHCCVAYLAMTEPTKAQITAAHAQLVTAYSKYMVDADGKMLAEYGAIDTMEPFPRRPSSVSWTCRRWWRSTSTSRSSTLCFV